MMRWLSFLVVAGLSLALFLTSCDSFLLTQNANAKPVALLYGITRYNTAFLPGTGQNLTYPEYDIVSMKSLFDSKNWEVLARTDLTATIASLKTDVADLSTRVSPGQRILFYFSGHGYTGNPKGTGTDTYIVFHSGIPASPVLFNSVALVSPSDLAAIFQPLVDKQACLIFILDSCYSGAFVATGAYATDLPDNYYVFGTGKISSPNPAVPVFSQELSNYFTARSSAIGKLETPDIWVVSAAGKGEESQEYTDIQHGLFTYYFLKAAEKTGAFMNADYDGDGFLSLAENYRYSREQLKLFNSAMTPSYLLENGDIQFLPHLSGNPLDIVLF